MFFFGSHEDAIQNDNMALLGGPSKTMTENSSRFRWDLMGEEPPRQMLFLTSILVILLHLLMVQWLMKSEEITNEAKPLVMGVTMIRIPAAKPAVAPSPPAPPIEKKPLPKKTPPKPVEKKPPPVVQKAPDFAPSQPATETPQPVSQPATSQAASSAPSSSSETTATAASEQFTEANFSANYAQNPKPAYPAIARSRGWTGKVLLKVKVSAEGLAEGVELKQSSGHEILDEAAIEAVKEWRFIPAKRGTTPVASSVIVPVDFKLKNN